MAVLEVVHLWGWDCPICEGSVVFHSDESPNGEVWVRIADEHIICEERWQKQAPFPRTHPLRGFGGPMHIRSVYIWTTHGPLEPGDVRVYSDGAYGPLFKRAEPTPGQELGIFDRFV